jgi:hypothetical protein
MRDMKRYIITIIVLLTIHLYGYAQTYTTNPSPFTAEDEVTLTINVTGTSLEGYTGDVWIWSWISKGCSSSCDAPTNIDPAGAANTENAKMTRDGVNADVYSITFVPTTFFGKSPAQLQQFGLKLKSESWGDGKQSDNDILIDIEPLIFIPKINRNFPSKVTEDDVVTLYLDQNLAEDFDLKYELSNFTLEVAAFDEDGLQLGTTVTIDATNKGDGIHSGSVLPTFSFITSGTAVDKITYKFISKNNVAIGSDTFEVIFIK